MLEPLRFVVHAIPRIAERLGGIRFDDAVPTYRTQCGAATRLGEANATVSLVTDEPLIGEPPQHSGDRRRSDAQRLCDLVRPRDAAAPGVGDLDLENRL